MSLKNYFTQPAPSSFAQVYTFPEDPTILRIPTVTPLMEPLWKSVLMDTLVRLPKAL